MNISNIKNVFKIWVVKQNLNERDNDVDNYAKKHKEWATDLGIVHNVVSTQILDLYKGLNFVGMTLKPTEEYTFRDLLKDTDTPMLVYFNN